MNSCNTGFPKGGGSGPELSCGPLPGFDEADLEDVSRAFQAAAPCDLGQAWQPEPSPGFAGGRVRVGWRRHSLLVFAELIDRDIHTDAIALNQRMWELGDTFEMFLRPLDRSAYVEFHVTPNNQRLQLRIPGPAALRQAQEADGFEALLLPGPVFRSRTWVRPEAEQWCVLAEIPSASVCGSAQALPGSCWSFSFSRYDYTRGSAEPVISSTSPHVEANFHRQEEWGRLTFLDHP